LHLLSNAQSTLFTVQSTDAESRLSEKDQLRWRDLVTKGYDRSPILISMEDVRNIQIGGIVTLDVPGTGKRIFLEAEMIRDNQEEGFSWTGKIIGGGQGYAIFAEKDLEKYGLLSLDGTTYEIIPFGNSIQAFVRQTSSGEVIECPEGGSTSPNITVDPTDPQCEPTNTENTCSALINLLVIVTPEAKIKLENMLNWGNYKLPVWLATIQTNFAFYNSHIVNKELKVKIIEAPTNFPFSANSNVYTDLSTLQNTYGPPIRQSNGADLVMLLAERDYGLTGGLGSWSLSPDPNQAYSIVRAEYILKFGIFQHELGHNLGCRHDWGSDDPITYICAHGYRYIKLVEPLIPFQTEGSGTSWRTIMAKILTPENGVETFYIYDDVADIAYNISDYGMIPYYSNPDVTYDNVPVGNATGYITDNAEQIRNSGCAVANYNTTQELNVQVTINKSCDVQVFTASVTPPAPGQSGQPPYEITWRCNDSGIFTPANPGVFIGTGTTVTLPEPYACPFYWVMCGVSSFDGTGTYRTKIMKVAVHPDCEVCEHDAPELPQKSTQIFDFQIAPNPLTDGSGLWVTPASPTVEATYDIIDVFGKIIATGNIPEGWTEPFELWTPRHMPSGNYGLRIRPADGTQKHSVKQFIVHKSR
jgi:hypothetical protein